jgi:2-desacetyl-2-hydroxyethyl bacteriochlorophyllide A dehydrogenase
MRAVVIEKPGQITVKDVPEPKPNKDEVVIAVRACGICGTDLHIADGEFPPTPYPIVPGHEFAGVIADGNGSEFGEGTLVAADPSLFCGRCDMCHAGRGNLCLRWNAIGDTVDGAFAEYVKVPLDNVYRLPDEMDARQGALVEPTACAVHGMRRLGDVAQQSAIVYGAGTMGLLLAQLLMRQGASGVTVVDRVAERLKIARDLGADTDDDPDKRYDIAVDATGVPALIERAASSLRRGGRLMIFGVARDDARVALSPFRIYNDELTIVGSMAVLDSFAAAITAIATGAVRTAPLLGGRTFALDEYPAALDHVRAGLGIKTQVLPAG